MQLRGILRWINKNINLLIHHGFIYHFFLSMWHCITLYMLKLLDLWQIWQSQDHKRSTTECTFPISQRHCIFKTWWKDLNIFL